MTLMQNPVAMLRNAATRRLGTMFPGYFPEVKHNHYRDFGWPDRVEFDQLYSMYDRNSVACAAVEKTSTKVWQDHPWLREREEAGEETGLEAEIRKRFSRLRVWQRVSEAERRSLVGDYSGLILRIADSKPFREPVDRVSGGLDALVEVIPAWQGQLTVSQWDTDQQSETFGQPKMFQFNEAAVDDRNGGQTRSFEVHPDRVIVWSTNGTVHGKSLLRAGYNDLMDMEKIKGAGGEGFWKNAKSAPILEIDKEAKLQEMAQAMGIDLGDLADEMNEQTEAWQKGFDSLLMIQGMQAKTLGITLPSPEHFYGIVLQSFAASIEMPVKILVGMQTGERASQEDAREWDQTCMGRRSDITIPNIMEFINRLERFGILPERDWFLDWADLTESTMEEKIDRAVKMSDVNQKNIDPVFAPEEIREAVGFEGDVPFDDEDEGDLGVDLPEDDTE